MRAHALVVVAALGCARPAAACVFRLGPAPVVLVAPVDGQVGVPTNALVFVANCATGGSITDEAGRTEPLAPVDVGGITAFDPGPLAPSTTFAIAACGAAGVFTTGNDDDVDPPAFAVGAGRFGAQANDVLEFTDCGPKAGLLVRIDVQLPADDTGAVAFTLDHVDLGALRTRIDARFLDDIRLDTGHVSFWAHPGWLPSPHAYAVRAIDVAGNVSDELVVAGFACGCAAAHVGGGTREGVAALVVVVLATRRRGVGSRGTRRTTPSCGA